MSRSRGAVDRVTIAVSVLTWVALLIQTWRAVDRAGTLDLVTPMILRTCTIALPSNGRPKNE